MSIADDEQCTTLFAQLGAAASALSARSFELTGVALPVEALLAMVLKAVNTASKHHAPPCPTGPVVSLAAVRAAKVPVVPSTFTITLGDVALLNQIAVGLHGAATDATRYAVVRDAFERGMTSLADEVKL